ncbi:hypothetical protein SteCoe_15685 [Stentor coeruleus]|uniref:Uncharacterized protein n=1 Tax=Stentor coeruleus TaxID=5963 RepID=A0A1R2C308_9CILI|nr:hypothetical protein SteCoe_15685 [Stentor coeruleus]
MCKLSNLCQGHDTNCDCKTSLYQCEIIKPVPIPLMKCSESDFMETFIRIISQQNELIKSIAEQTKATLEKISELVNQDSIEKAQINPVTNEDITTSTTLLHTLCGENTNFSHFLHLDNDIPTPAYKERAFSLILSIQDLQGNKTILPRTVIFKVLLYTAENPPKLLSISTSGDKIMRGTLEVEGESVIFFRKIIVKEVTSHFRNGSLFFVIVPKDADYIKPLIIENFIIKARKMPNDEIKKKCKIAQDEVQV